MWHPLCWLVGCKQKIDWEGGTRYSASREAVIPCMVHYCIRCSTKVGGVWDKTSINQGIYYRGLYGRTIPLWISKWRNRRFAREMARRHAYSQTEEGRRETVEHFEERARRQKARQK